MTSRVLASLLLSALATATAAGCSGPTRPTAAATASASARPAACVGAHYAFGKPVTTTRLLSVSPAHRLSAGQSMNDDEHQVRTLRATAVSSAGEADAAAAYRAYAAIAAEHDVPLAAFNTITSTYADGGRTTVGGPGRFLSMHYARVDTVGFTRRCTHGSPATGTVTAWHEGPGAAGLQCNYTPPELNSAMREAQHLACDRTG